MRVNWGEGYPAFRTPLDLPFSRVLVQTAEESLGSPIIQLPTSGASLGLYHFAEVLKVPLIFVPIVNHDNNQHGENENLRIQNLWDGIELIAGTRGPARNQLAANDLAAGGMAADGRTADVSPGRLSAIAAGMPPRRLAADATLSLHVVVI